MSKFDVKIKSMAYTTILQLPKQDLAEKGITPENSVVVILTPNSVKCEILKKYLIFKNIDKVLDKSSVFLAVVPSEDYLAIATSYFNDETLTRFEKETKIKYLNEGMLTPDKNFKVTIPLTYHSMFSQGNFKLVVNGKKCGVFSDVDLIRFEQLAKKTKSKKTEQTKGVE